MKIYQTLYTYDKQWDYHQYMTIYKDCLGRFYLSYAHVDKRKQSLRFSIREYTASDVAIFQSTRAVCTTHYVDPAGNLRDIQCHTV